VVSSSPPDSTIVGIPGKIIEGESTTKQDIASQDHARLPDPVAKAMTALADKLNQLNVRLDEIMERQNCLEDKLLPVEHHTNGVVAKSDNGNAAA
jgi:hypothetical protein